MAETPHWPARQEGRQVKALSLQPKSRGGVHGQMAASHAVNWLLCRYLHVAGAGRQNNNHSLRTQTQRYYATFHILFTAKSLDGPEGGAARPLLQVTTQNKALRGGLVLVGGDPRAMAT